MPPSADAIDFRDTDIVRLLMRPIKVVFLLPVLLVRFASAQSQPRAALDVYVIDVEGGNATLFVSPSRESLLIDTGNAGVAAVRDAGRIVDAMTDAGIRKIDRLITTHWHGDHFGGMAELASRVSIGEFIDHGPNVQPGEAADTFLREVYPRLYSKARHTVAKPGDRIPLAGAEVRVVTSAGETIKTPLAGAGKPNPYCAAFKPGENNAEDPQSLGVHVAFGKFRTIHLGDLTRNKEFELMCPNNRIGAVDVLLGLHHGQATSNSEVIVHALRPRVAIMNNGTRKGGEPDVMKIVHTS
ncbi:MAG: MBL fold metallo-hydrolase, partial [Bryobacterales bacterium]|nr:MBL fold metallo-hydrolase [Bryobacterales bacterium]